ncbi:MAG: hypothetical protein ACP5ER_05070 [Candidatus Bathyarchaeales archaeon]
MLRGMASAFMVCEAIALYEVFMKYAMSELEFTSDGSSPQFYLPMMKMIFPYAFTIFIELATYFKVLKPINREALNKLTVTKHWVNVLFFLSLFFGGLITTGGIVAIALSAILVVALETRAE